MAKGSELAISRMLRLNGSRLLMYMGFGAFGV